MNSKLEKLIEQLIPYLVIGVVIAFFLGLVVMLSSVLVWGLIIGSIIWVVSLVKAHFFPTSTTKQKGGRVIEHSDRD